MANDHTDNTQRRPTQAKHVRYFIKWPRRLAVFLILLPLAAYIAVESPPVQNRIRQWALNYLRSELHTRVEASSFRFHLFSGAVLHDFYLEDRRGDTLLYARRLLVRLDKSWLTLINHHLAIARIDLDSAALLIRRPRDSITTNAQFVLDYFATPNKKDKQFRLAIKTLHLRAIRFQNRDDRNGRNLDSFLHDGHIRVDSLDLKNKRYYIREVTLNRPMIALFRRDTALSPPPARTPDTTARSPLLHIGKLQIRHGYFSRDDYTDGLTADTAQARVDFRHLTFPHVQATIRRLHFDGTHWQTRRLELSVREQSGFEWKSFTADAVAVGPEETSLTRLRIRTGAHAGSQGSRLACDLQMKYDSWNSFRDFAHSVFIRAALTDCRLDLNDLFYFAPGLRQNRFLALHHDKPVTFSGNFTGRINDPRIRDLRLHFADSDLEANIKVGDILDRAHTSFNVAVRNVRTSVRTLRTLLPHTALPRNLDKLGTIRFAGSLDGFTSQMVAFGALQTDIGHVQADMKLDLTTGFEQARYSGQLNVTDFDLATYFDQTRLGKITFRANVKEGRGIHLNSAKALLDAQIDKLDFNNYTYRHIVLNGKLERNLFNGLLQSDDPNFDLKFNGSIDFTDTIAKYNFKTQIQKLDLYRLHWSKKPLYLAGHIQMNLHGSDPKKLSGTVISPRFVFNNGTEAYRLDSVRIEARTDGPLPHFLRIESKLVKGQLQGEFDLATLPAAIKNAFIQNSPSFAHKLHWQRDTTTTVAQVFDFRLTVPDSRHFTKIIRLPLDSLQGIGINGHFNSRDSTFAISAALDKIVAGSKVIRNTIADVNGKPGKIKLDAFIFETQLNDRRSLPPISLKLTMGADTLSFRIKSSNISNVLKSVHFNGEVLPYDDYFELRFKPSKFRLAKENWHIAEDNYLRVGRHTLEAKNIVFHSGDKLFKLTTPDPNSLELDLKNFDLSFINSLYNYENLQYTGPFQAAIRFGDVRARRDLTVSLTADTLFINGLSYGAMEFSGDLADFHSPANVRLSIGADDMLRAKGYVYFFPKSRVWRRRRIQPRSIHLDGHLRRFPFRIMKDIIPNGISNVRGDFDGRITISGPLTGPEFDGLAHINHGELTVDYLKTHYTIDDQDVRITTTRFDATGGVIKDKFGHTAVIEGGLYHRRFHDFGLNVKIRSDRFLVLDTHKGDNPLYYGTVLAEAEAQFSGPMETPVLYVRGKSLENTELNLLFTEEHQVEQTSFVHFIRFDKPQATGTGRDVTPRGLDIRMQFEVTEDALIQLIFDEVTGDIIRSRGTGDFTLSLKRDGEFTMNGLYTIGEGEYLFTLLNLVNKPFIIEPGSTITWTGEATKAELDIRAKYRGLKAPVYNLIREELTAADADNATKRQAKQVRDIDLGLILTGPMLHPQIQFSISINNLVGNIKNYASNKLALLKNNPNELNRQVFGLLVFGNFLPPGNNLGFQQSEAVVSGIYSTLSEMLATQLALHINSFLAEVIGTSKIYSGTEVDVGINYYQDFQTAGNTPGVIRPGAFRFNLRNSFFNNRLAIYLGGNVGLERNAELPAGTNDFSGDIRIEVELTKNRRFHLQVYNRFEPDYTGTRYRQKKGIGLKYNREFDSFGELFKGLRRLLNGK